MRRASLIAGLALVGRGLHRRPALRDVRGLGPFHACIGAAAGVGRCLRYCDSFCEDGAWCRDVEGSSVCWEGGATGEGEIVLDPADCAFGLAPVADYAAEPLAERCVRVCDPDDAEPGCAAGEDCLAGRCGSLDCHTRPCGPLDHCVNGTCVNERRYARLDCDGDTYPDCRLDETCDVDRVWVLQSARGGYPERILALRGPELTVAWGMPFPYAPIVGLGEGRFAVARDGVFIAQ